MGDLALQEKQHSQYLEQLLRNRQLLGSLIGSLSNHDNDVEDNVD